AHAAHAAKKPNVVVFVLGAARSDHFGCYGYDRETTPQIDLFAASGRIHTNVFAEGSYTFVSTANPHPVGTRADYCPLRREPGLRRSPLWTASTRTRGPGIGR
ncbi:MAG: sulfatase-like hydrolase/transferase, partial [Deltaproteobacteria bacterium]|nr:sulfatase-like hydrolase/transferase [Deltaproteobacteria bacterium]